MHGLILTSFKTACMQEHACLELMTWQVLVTCQLGVFQAGACQEGQGARRQGARTRPRRRAMLAKAAAGNARDKAGAAGKDEKPKQPRAKSAYQVRYIMSPAQCIQLK